MATLGPQAPPVHCLLIPDGESIVFITTFIFLIFLQERNFFVPMSQPELGKQKINRVGRVFQKQIGVHKQSDISVVVIC